MLGKYELGRNKCLKVAWHLVLGCLLISSLTFNNRPLKCHMDNLPSPCLSSFNIIHVFTFGWCYIIIGFHLLHSSIIKMVVLCYHQVKGSCWGVLSYHQTFQWYLNIVGKIRCSMNIELSLTCHHLPTKMPHLFLCLLILNMLIWIFEWFHCHWLVDKITHVWCYF
jgi:hypothetical protein